MADSETARRPWLAWGALALAVVVVVAVAVLVVRAARDPAAVTPATSAAPTPGAASSSGSATPTPTPTARPSTSTPSTTSTTSTTRPTPAASPTASRSSARPKPSEDPTAVASTKEPVEIDEPDEVQAGLSARVSKLEAVAGEARGPGEVAGPALRASITLTNTSDEAVDLSLTVVNLYYGADETPAPAVSGPGASALPRRLKAGAKGTGRFVYSVPLDQRADVLITVDYSVATPVVAFRGRAPR